MPFFSVSIFDFEQVNVSWVLLKRSLLLEILMFIFHQAMVLSQYTHDVVSMSFFYQGFNVCKMSIRCRRRCIDAI